MAYGIRDWVLYEPREKIGGTHGPLAYAKLRVHAFATTITYRKLAAIAGADLMAALGLFTKLIEMAADQPREFRDGMIRQRREGPPATAEDIAFATMFNVDDVRRCIGYLMHPSVGWLEETSEGGTADSGRERETAGDGGKSPAIAGETRPYLTDTQTDTDTKTHSDESETRHRAPRSNDALWDALCKAFNLSPVTKSEKSRVGKIVADLTAKGANPHDIDIRLERYRRAWPQAADTPEALLKHWDRFAREQPAGRGRAGTAGTVAGQGPGRIHGESSALDDVTTTCGD